MHQHALRFAIDLVPTTGGPVTVDFHGQATFTGADPTFAAAQLGPALQSATRDVVQGKLSNHQVALPTLGSSLTHFVPDIVAVASRSLISLGIQLSGLQLGAHVPQHAVAPAASQVMSGSDIAKNVAGNFAQNAIAQSMPRPHIRANVGGFRINVGPGSDSVGDQVQDELRSRLLHYAIVGGVLVLVSGICVIAIAARLLF